MSHAGDMLFLPPSHGRRRTGRQATSYASYIQKLLGDTESDLKPEASCSLLLRGRMMVMMMNTHDNDKVLLDIIRAF